MPIVNGIWICPEPTEEQKANAILRGYDAWDLLGSLPFWDLKRDDPLAAAAPPHDEGYLIGGDAKYFANLDLNFDRDVFILANVAANIEWERDRAWMMSRIVYLFGHTLHHTDDWNTEITRAQGKLISDDAKRHINKCAVQINCQICPYPEVVIL